MTTPTREQVVQWADECGLTKGQHWNRENMTTAFMTDFATMARADLEATIAEQAAELEVLRVAHRAHEDSNLKMLAKLKQQAHELESLQCKIDALMLEYCPDEMTEEQKVEWARHQRPVSDQRREAARRITIQG